MVGSKCLGVNEIVLHRLNIIGFNPRPWPHGFQQASHSTDTLPTMPLTIIHSSMCTDAGAADKETRTGEFVAGSFACRHAPFSPPSYRSMNKREVSLLI